MLYREKVKLVQHGSVGSHGLGDIFSVATLKNGKGSLILETSQYDLLLEKAQNKRTEQCLHLFSSLLHR